MTKEGEEKGEELETTTTDPAADEAKEKAKEEAEAALTKAKASLKTAGEPETLESTVGVGVCSGFGKKWLLL